jgi:thioredoxin-like negative regulator of GroEL
MINAIPQVVAIADGHNIDGLFRIEKNDLVAIFIAV